MRLIRLPYGGAWVDPRDVSGIVPDVRMCSVRVVFRHGKETITLGSPGMQADAIADAAARAVNEALDASRS